MAGTIPEIIDMARKAGLDAAADRLDYLCKLDRLNGDEPINPKTVKSLVSFMIEHPELATDVITVNPEGFVSASWNITQDGELDAQFLPSGNVWFFYTVDEPDSDRFRILKKGDATPNDMLKAVMPFIEHAA